MNERGRALSRQDQQQRTRAALVVAARMVFARDGFHGARLDVIANEAGYSKGAVYSNFANKAELFLAVLDLNITAVTDAQGVQGSQPWSEDGPELAEAIRGMSLATLEFIAAAARDPELSRQTSLRVEQMVTGYAALAAEAGATEGALSIRDVGALLAALDQGMAVLQLAGVPKVSDRAIDMGLQALASIDPASIDPDSIDPDSTDPAGMGLAAGEASGQDGVRDGLSDHQRTVRRRVAAHIARLADEFPVAEDR